MIPIKDLTPRILSIPIFPLQTVLFPGGDLPLRIFEARYVEMTKECIRDNSVFGVCLIRGGFETGTPALCHLIGCTAQILSWDVPSPGLFTLETRGERIFRILEQHVAANGLIRALVELNEDPAPVAVPADYAPLKHLLEELHKRGEAPSRREAATPDDAAWVGDRLAELLPLTPERKQRWLEDRNPLATLAGIQAELESLRMQKF